MRDDGHDPAPGRHVDRGRVANGDVRRFLTAYAISALGSGTGSGALPLVAVLLLHAWD